MKVLVATKERLVFDILRSKTASIEPVLALDTRRIYESIPGAELVIVDYHDLIPQPFSEGFVRKLLEQVRCPVCSSSDFIASPDSYLRGGEPMVDFGLPPKLTQLIDRFFGWHGEPMVDFGLPPKRTVVFTSYSGGTGKTSLALDTAFHFAAKSKSRLPLPTAVMEFTYGRSALQALVGGGQPTLYDLISRPELEPGELRAQSVTIYPMDYENLRSLPIEQVQHYCHEQIGHHVLTVIDTLWPHGLVSAVRSEVDLWIVVTTPRIDAVENAKKLHRELALEHGDDKVIVVVNQMGGLAAYLALLGTDRDVEIPRLQQASVASFNGRLGREILMRVYDGLWQEYERGSARRRRLFRRKLI